MAQATDWQAKADQYNKKIAEAQANGGKTSSGVSVAQLQAGLAQAQKNLAPAPAPTSAPTPKAPVSTATSVPAAPPTPSANVVNSAYNSATNNSSSNKSKPQASSSVSAGANTGVTNAQNTMKQYTTAGGASIQYDPTVDYQAQINSATDPAIKKALELQRAAKIYGENLAPYQDPALKSLLDSTYGLRSNLEAQGYTVGWDPNTGKATATKGDMTIPLDTAGMTNVAGSNMTNAQGINNITKQFDQQNVGGAPKLPVAPLDPRLQGTIFDSDKYDPKNVYWEAANLESIVKSQFGGDYQAAMDAIMKRDPNHPALPQLVALRYSKINEAKDTQVIAKNDMGDSFQRYEPQFMPQAQMADLLNMNYNEADITQKVTDVIKEEYAKLGKEYDITESNFAANITKMIDQINESRRRNTSQATATGASAGLGTAMDLTSMLKLSQEGVQGATELAQGKAMLGDKRTEAMAKARLDGFKEFEKIKEFVANSGLAKYGYDTNLSVGKLATTGQLGVGDMNADATKYNADKSADATKTAAQIQANAPKTGGSTGTTDKPVEPGWSDKISKLATDIKVATAAGKENEVATKRTEIFAMLTQQLPQMTGETKEQYQARLTALYNEFITPPTNKVVDTKKLQEDLLKGNELYKQIISKNPNNINLNNLFGPK